MNKFLKKGDIIVTRRKEMHIVLSDEFTQKSFSDKEVTRVVTLNWLGKLESTSGVLEDGFEDLLEQIE